jgi:ClpP class serine protease
MLLEFGFAQQLLNIANSGSNADLKNLFVAAPCPRMEAERQCAAAKSAGRTDRKAVAVLPVRGVLDQHSSWMMEMMGGTSVESLSAAFEMCMNEDRIGSVMFDMHTPGGSPFGIKEISDRIFAARSEKLTVSISNSLMCSAGAWLGAAADRSFVSPMSQNASVGVYSMFIDQSKAMEEMGVTVTICRIPEGKAEGHPYEPLKPEAVQHKMASIGAIYDEFVSSMAKYRGVSVSHVKEHFGQGRCLDAKGAVAAGLADGVMSFQQLAGRMQVGSVRRQSTGAAAIVENDGPTLDSRDSDSFRRRMTVAELE